MEEKTQAERDEQAAREYQEWLEGKRAERPRVKVTGTVTIRKFDGEYAEGAKPIEIVQREEDV